ncbi:Trihelix transcription factor GT-2 [Rhynchospora pubera]|uniref:Trihelix transcription factor GT-2 n=1 Tax=Rhynchospora pubera TaxID=906938 RepID=A0AAV8E7U9_9POAL|nr:Trihelix transcription factor GT-2 [Rhynchospora pubera]KAJ4777373.1 Trihelix transcription factor GT-2 [Rhynchospora pubera]
MQQPPPPPGGTQYGVPPSDMSPFASPTSTPRPMQLPAEAASPINSRPPPQSFEELLPGGGAGNFPDDLGGDETGRGGASGNRWPRQETLALLKIRSDMDATFRDATLKGPLWEEVSRKLAELGYRRSAKKCKEKFENVHKYYKRTKENRAGRQDGKTYRFFQQLEALHASSPTTPTQSGMQPTPLASVQVPTQIPVTSPVTIGFSAPMAGPSRVVAPVTPIETPSQPILRSIQDIGTSGPPPQVISGSTTPTTVPPTAPGISFSSNTESSESDESDDEDTEEIGGTQEQGKRKRQGGSGSGGSSKKMMSFFEGLMKQVMERQEAMQQRFLETIEKREQDRMIREEAWRRQEMARLSREQEILAQERAMAASRDAAVVSFIQKITGQTIPLPTIPAPVITIVPPPPQAVPVVATPQSQQHLPPQHAQSQPSPKTPRQQNPQPLPAQASTPPAVPQPQLQQQQQPQPQSQPQPTPQPQQQLQQHHHQSTDIVVRQQQPPATPTDMVLSVPESQEHGMGAGFEPGSSSVSSSRWPKAEVHALIKLRSNMDSRYQEAGPKGPLWEEISSGMRRLGYNRNAKRCKEKWENINKYFKKVKESNKKRPEDSKTCPYFHQLDALYRNKYGGTTGGAGGSQFDANANPNSQDSLTFSGPPPPHGPSQPQPISQQPPAGETDSRNTNAGKDNASTHNDSNRNGNGTDGGNCGTGGTQIPTSNGAATSTFYTNPSSMGLKKPEDIMKELMEQRQRHNGYDKFDEGEADSMDDEDDEYDDDDDGEDDEDGKMQYKIQFQRPNMNVNVSGTGGGNPPTSTAPGTTPGSNSFLAMVK